MQSQRGKDELKNMAPTFASFLIDDINVSEDNGLKRSLIRLLFNLVI